MSTHASSHDKGHGYITFAGVMFLALGVFNVIDGAVALAGDQNFIEHKLFFGNLTFWGIVLISVGVLELVAGVRLFQGRGQLIALTLLMLNLIVQFWFLPAYPIWSVLIMAVSGVLIYGISVYGEHFERT